MKGLSNMRTVNDKYVNKASTCRKRHGITSLSFFTLSILLGFGLMTSCIADDQSNCYFDASLTLLFEYTDEEGNDAFDDNIKTVDLYLFDENKFLHDHITVGSAALTNFRGINLDLDPGDYYVVAWANVSTDYTTPTFGTDYERLLMEHNEQAGTIPALFYAPDKREPASRNVNIDASGKVKLTKKETTVHTLPFMGAYHTIEVYIKGIEKNRSMNAVVSGLSRAYDYDLTRVEDETLNFEQSTSFITVEDEDYYAASFRVPHFANNNEIVVSVESVDFPIDAGSKRLEEFMRENSVTVTDGNPSIIRVMFEYSSDGTLIQVSFPPFKGIDVIGGF